MEAFTVAGLTVHPVSGPVLCRSERRVLGRVVVERVGQVAPLVRAARERGWALHPISSGKNWGMGSYLPRQHDRLIVDLSRLKGIGPFDAIAGTVRIEAGVTQQDLYTWLQREAPDWAFNVTGAAAETSLVGNAMERGIGYDGSRADEVFGHEVVLPDGTEHGPEAEWFSTTGNLPVGPRVDALWSQSEYGIVTAVWIKLRRRQAAEVAVIINGDYAAVFGALEQAYRQQVLVLPTHMAGNERAEVVSAGLLHRLWGRAPTPAEVRAVFPLVRGHTAITALRGTRRMVRAGVKELRRLGGAGVTVRALGATDLGRAERVLRFFGQRNRADFVAAIRPLLAMTWGEPSDAGMSALRSETDSDPDLAEEGCMYFNAVSALDRAQSAEVERIVREELGMASVTRCVLGPAVLVHIMTYFFPPKDATAAADAVARLGARLRAEGFPPYRLGLATTRNLRGLGSRLSNAVEGIGISPSVEQGTRV